MGLPVHRLMGGPLRSRIQAYATGFYRKRGADPVSYLIDETRQRVDASLRGFAEVDRFDDDRVRRIAPQ